MLEVHGFVGNAGRIVAEVVLDAEKVGTIALTLAQWDRLREHARTAAPSQATGLAIVIEALDADRSAQP